MREILGVEVADTESEATYQELFRSLKARGLEGLKAAVSRHFQGASWWQRGGRCPLRQEPAREGGRQEAQGSRGGSAGDLRRGEDRAGAGARHASVAEAWRGKGNERVAEHLEEHVQECP